MSALHVIPGEFSTFTIAIAILSGFIVFFGYVSMFIKERWLILTCLPILVVALIVGIIAGPLVSNGFDPNSWNDADEITKELTRCILAIQVSRESVYEVFQLIDRSHFSSLGNGCRY